MNFEFGTFYFDIGTYRISHNTDQALQIPPRLVQMCRHLLGCGSRAPSSLGAQGKGQGTFGEFKAKDQSYPASATQRKKTGNLDAPCSTSRCWKPCVGQITARRTQTGTIG